MQRATARLDQVRSRCDELENHYIDELCAGRLSRRDFLGRGAMVGMSATAMGAVLAACGGANSSQSSASGGRAPAVKRGGVLNVAQQAPTATINPLTVADDGGGVMICQTGEYLIRNNVGRPQQRQLEPALAVGWRPSSAGSVWTFKLRPGVKFHDGSPLTADDVVYTFRELTDTKNASNALSVFGPILDPAGVVKVDSMTVAFHLSTPVGNFPYLVSNDSYNAIIVRKGTDYAKWQSTFLGTGPFKLKSYSQNVGASFVRNPDYWGPKPPLAGSQFTFFQSQSPAILALQSGEVDVASFTVHGGQAIVHDSQYRIVRLRSSTHHELSMRCDQAPFTDPRVRQAMALTLDRPALVQALLGGYGTVGNESPFAPIFASTDKSVPQRVQDLSKAKHLLSAAGHPNGFSTTLYSEIFEELPDLAQAIKADAAKVGINIGLKVESSAAYYGKATFGNSDWLDGTMSLVIYAGRGVPNVVLQSAFTSKGVWNAARFHDPRYDALVKQYTAALDLQTQRRLAGEIQTLLLDKTPVIVPYFTDGLIATKANVYGVYESQGQQIFLDRAYKS